MAIRVAYKPASIWQVKEGQGYTISGRRVPGVNVAELEKLGMVFVRFEHSFFNKDLVELIRLWKRGMATRLRFTRLAIQNSFSMTIEMKLKGNSLS